MFNSTVGGFQFIYSFQVIPSLPFALRFGVDGISIFFILLTNLFIYLCILSLNTSTYKIKEVLLHLLFLQ
jgi:NADH-quinone oxidoreductase subunit M